MSMENDIRRHFEALTWGVEFKDEVVEGEKWRRVVVTAGPACVVVRYNPELIDPDNPCAVSVFLQDIGAKFVQLMEEADCKIKEAPCKT